MILAEFDKLDPDTVNTTPCRYTGPDGGHCIAGQVLVNLGLRVPDDTSGYLRGCPDSNFALLNGASFDDLAGEPFMAEQAEFEPLAVDLLNEAQSAADAGYEWGRARAKALAAVEARR